MRILAEASPANPHPRRAALEAVADALVRVSDALRIVAAEPAPAPGPRLVGREPEVLLSIKQAAELLGGASETFVERLVRGKACKRKVGGKVLIEREGLLALTRKGKA
jgi:hypothetical protein